MQRSPIREKKGLASFSVICFEIGAARLAIVNTKVFLSLDREGGEPMIVRCIAERAPNSAVSPARAATAARKETQASGIDAD